MTAHACAWRKLLQVTAIPCGRQFAISYANLIGYISKNSPSLQVLTETFLSVHEGKNDKDIV